MKEDANAKSQLVSIWNAAYVDGELDNLIDYINETADLLDESQTLNFKRWKILDIPVHGNFQALGSYDAEVKTVKSYVTQRFETFKNLINR